MSFGRDMAQGIATQIGGLVLLAFVLGGAAALTLYCGVSWLWNHVSVSIN